jgi:hypothetical protein
MTWLRKFLNWLHPGTKPSAIVEPPGGIDGMDWSTAFEYAQAGDTVRRSQWPAGMVILWDDARGDFMRRFPDGLMEAYDIHAPQNTADYVSCDWGVETGRRQQAEGN